MKQFFFFLLSSVFCLLSSENFAQKKQYSTHSKEAIKYFEMGTMYFDSRQNDQAKMALIRALKADSNFIEAHLVLGDVYFELRENESAIEEYKKVIKINPDFFPKIYFTLATWQLNLGEYDDANKNFQKFMTYPVNSSDLLQKTKRCVEICKFAIDAIKHPVPFNPVNLGDSINTKYGEYSPAITADEQTLFFTEMRPFGNARRPTEDIYFSNKKDGVWSRAMSVGSPVNTESNEGAVSIAPDGQTLYFVSSREDGYGKTDIYEVKKIGNYWSEPKNLGRPVNTPFNETQPSIASDGITLYFVSNRPGGLGGFDIWKTVKQPNGEWGEPSNLGNKINSSYNEQSPFIHPDNQTLYFIADGLIGMGKNDFFYSKLDTAGNWSIPVNLGYPINSFADERNIIVNAKGDYAYITSDHLNNAGNFDIYGFELAKGLRPMRVSYMKGKVYDFTTKRSLSAKFELIDLQTEKTVIESFSNKGNGEFLVCLPVDKNYALNVSCPGYLFYSENFSFKNPVSKGESGGEAQDAFLMDVPLHPIKSGEIVVLKNIFFETNDFTLKNESKAELKKLIIFLNANPAVKIEISGHTDNVGEKKYNQTLSEKRAKAVYDYLMKAAVAKERLTYKGYGDIRPIAKNDTEEGKAKNRRTEFMVQ